MSTHRTLGEEIITAETVENWLRHAGAKQPWDAEGIRVTVANLEALRETELMRRLTPKPRTPAERAQKAIKELRNALQKLSDATAIEWEEMGRIGMQGGPIGTWYRDQTAKVQAMQSALVDLPPMSHAENPWIIFARAAYQCFLLTVPRGRANREEESSAIKFVQQALIAGGFPDLRSPATIETILLTRRTKADLT